MRVSSVEAYEQLAAQVELQVQQLLPDHNYNTVGNFVRFYVEFKNSGFSQLEDFLREYTPPITPEHHTCVGLGLELLKKLWQLEPKFPGLASKFYVVSCEEAIENGEQYMAQGAPPVQLAEKEHILLALRIVVNNRSGFMVLDPGYHVARVVTVMADKQYPHTGWFTQKEDAVGLQEYKYEMSEEGSYLRWGVKGRGELHSSLIYVERPFLCAVQCTERRNLVYNFKSLLARDTKGHVLAGLYFDLAAPHRQLTLFCQDADDPRPLKRKLCFRTFLQKHLPPEVEELTEECARQLGLCVDQLVHLLATLAAILDDHDFVQQTLAINEAINKIAADN